MPDPNDLDLEVSQAQGSVGLTCLSDLRYLGLG